jgi:GTP-binding protein EngB required for normal cell division
MSEPQSTNEHLNSIPHDAAARLNDAQKLHFRVSIQYIDQLLQDVEGILHATESKSPFPKYRIDLSPAQGRVLEDYIRRLRAQLLRALSWQNIDPPPPDVPATRAISTRLHFVDNALADLRPKEMRGAGSLSEESATELSGVIHELSSLVENMMTYLQQELRASLRGRIERLATNDVLTEKNLLRNIEEVVTHRGLVEFRPRIDMLLSRLEDQTFEVAVFGRVSSGKSSFLDALLDTTLLPVGVNPITAVPTRIRYGPDIAAFLRYGNGEMQRVSVEDFQTVISEMGNPGNRRAVTRTLLEIPAPRLSRGVVLVDTPGLGSLALRGASETIAYLPSCDLALLLIDAASTLTAEDIGTLRLILEAEIPALVLLSKSDLLRPEEVQSTVTYIEGQVDRELHRSVAIHPISSTREYRPSLDAFYAEELQPRLERAHELKAESVASKLGRLQHDVIAALEAKLSRAENVSIHKTVNPELIERRLREISGNIGRLAPWLEQRIEALRDASQKLIVLLAEELSKEARNSSRAIVLAPDISQHMQHVMTQQLEPLITEVNEALSRAIDDTTRIGIELGRTDLPDRKELDPLVRDFPRFFTAIVPQNISIGIWKYLGEKATSSHLQKQLRGQFGTILQEELRNYTVALFQWARNLAQSLDFSMNSYVETYRVATQESMSEADSQSDLAGIREDIHTLLAADNEISDGANEVTKGV